jgi:hypothetical protein
MARKAKPKLSPQEKTAQQAAQHAQNWLPFQAIQDNCLLRKDGALVAGIKIAPFNLTLKSPRETQGIIQSFQAALNGLNAPWQWVSLSRPVDLEAYGAHLDHVAAQISGPRQPILRAYQHWVQGQAHDGSQVERRYYLLMTRHGKDAQAEHRTALRGFLDDIARIRGFRALVLDEALWHELLFLVFHADQAARETIPDGRPRPIPHFHAQEVLT